MATDFYLARSRGATATAYAVDADGQAHIAPHGPGGYWYETLCGRPVRHGLADRPEDGVCADCDQFAPAFVAGRHAPVIRKERPVPVRRPAATVEAEAPGA